MAIREGKWRCPYCSGVNPGRELRCSGCGATRAEDVRFFLEDDAPEVQDEKLVATARAGADWLCLFCSTSNRPDATVCVQCGAEKGTAPSRPVRMVGEAPAAPQAALPPRPPAQRSGCGPKAWGCLSLLAVLFGLFLWVVFRKSVEPVEVSALEWERTIDVEAYRTVREEAWEGSVPSGARVVGKSREVQREEREQVGTERVKVGTRDLGNGFFEDVYEDRPVYESKPVYGTRYTYEIERWVKDRTARASGRDPAPRWPDPGLGRGEREGARREAYTVVLRGKREYRMELPYARWSSLRVGQRLTATVRGFGRVVKLE
jgi:hypothetical protein